MKMSLGLEKRIELEMRGRPADQILDLNLDNCKATKVEGFSVEFTNLQSLSLINLGLQTLEGFPKLGNLRKLELSDNRISGGLNHLAGCPNITHLSLSGNKIKDINALDGLKDLHFLRSLDLFNCELTNIDQYRQKVFAKLSQITYLDGFDIDEEQEDVDGEEDEDDDENDIDEEEDDDEEDEDEVGLSYLTKNIDDEEDDEEEFEPGEEGEDEDDHIVEGVDDDEEDSDNDEDDALRGTKRKHDEEEEDKDEDA